MYGSEKLILNKDDSYNEIEKDNLSYQYLFNLNDRIMKKLKSLSVARKDKSLLT